jgi:hypothetical protein
VNDFVDATDPEAVEQVLVLGLAGLGLDGLVEQLSTLPGLKLDPGRPGGLLRAATPPVLEVEERSLALFASGGGELRHTVGGVVLARDPVTITELPGVLAALLVRSLPGTGAQDQLSVLLTSIRDAVG